jgi:TRAP-type C4-dicarboxylate transport system permease small subunit
MIGAMVAVRDGTHFDVDLMPPPKTKREQGVSRLIVHLGMLLMALVFSWYGIQFAQFGAIQNSEMSGINMLSIYISFPLAGMTWILFLLEKIVEDVGLITSKPTDTQT